jgi:hypothetical protein
MLLEYDLVQRRKRKSASMSSSQHWVEPFLNLPVSCCVSYLYEFFSTAMKLSSLEEDYNQKLKSLCLIF